MRKIRILNLYNEALELNGDTMNVTAFTNRLEEMGCEYEVLTGGVGDEADFAAFDMVFVCHGKPRNVAAVSTDFLRRRESFAAAMEKDVPMLFTGSANMLLGKSFSLLGGESFEGMGIFDCTCAEFDGMYVSDAVLVPEFAPEQRMFGTYYRCEKVAFGEDKPNLFKVSKNLGGEGAVGAEEGFRKGNLFATWVLGPVLARNPLMLKELLRLVLGEDYRETDFSLEQRAVDMILAEIG